MNEEIIANQFTYMPRKPRKHELQKQVDDLQAAIAELPDEFQCTNCGYEFYVGFKQDPKSSKCLVCDRTNQPPCTKEEIESRTPEENWWP